MIGYLSEKLPIMIFYGHALVVYKLSVNSLLLSCGRIDTSLPPILVEIGFI